MAKAKKLPSGSWRVLVYSHTQKTLDEKTGTWKEKRIYESFTSNDPTAAGKRQVEKDAAVWAANKERKKRPTDYELGDAIDAYCNLKSNVLSPATIREYKRMRKTYFDYLINTKLTKLADKQLQQWINQFAANHSPKTVRNAYGLISAVLDVYDPEHRIKVTLPQKIKPQLYVPTDADIKTLLNYFSKKDKDMEIAVYLAAVGTLRRSEICALQSSDVSGNSIHINKAMVDAGGKWTLKTTKTTSSTRIIEMPEYVIDILPKDGQLVNLTPSKITNRFAKALNKLSVPHFRFHDLRHYAASVMHAIGVPDQYIMARGGWATDSTLKQIYRGTMSDYFDSFNKKIIGHFNDMQHEIQHDGEEE